MQKGEEGRALLLECEYLKKVSMGNADANYMRGFLYCNGLGGVQMDIKQGVAYLQKSGIDKAREELLNYKKTFLGKWVRR